MTLSPVVAESVAAYEQEHGSKPADLVLQIAEHILKVGKMFTNLGQKDSREGKAPYPADVFPALVIKAFRMDVAENQICGNLTIWTATMTKVEVPKHEP